MISKNSAIQIQSLSHQYKDRWIFQDLSWDFQRGECIALVGPSGVGKSTFLHLCGTLLPIQQGDIRIQGRSLRDMSESEKVQMRRKTLGFVYQFHHLLPELTAYENILLPLKIQCRHQPLEDIQKYLMDLGITHGLHSYPHELSGGECQRIAIVRAMITKPAILFADEPTGNLDPQTSQTVFCWMKDAAKHYNQTILFATHNQDLAQQADRIMTL